MKRSRWYCAVALTTCAVALSVSCKPADNPERGTTYTAAPAAAPEYIFAIHPLHNPQRLEQLYGPVVDFAGRGFEGPRLRLEASRSYDEFEKKLYARRFAFALPNPYQTLRALEHGYRVFGKMGGDERFRGILIVRRDARPERVADLRGKAIGFPAPTALAATMMPLYFLHQQLDVNRDITRHFAGSQESSIMSVYLRHTAAAATWPPPWEAFQKDHPDVARELVVRWETPALVNNGLVVRDDVPPEVLDRVARALFTLHEHTEGRALLAALPLSRFEPATRETYRPVEEFLARYNEAVH